MICQPWPSHIQPMLKFCSILIGAGWKCTAVPVVKEKKKYHVTYLFTRAREDFDQRICSNVKDTFNSLPFNLSDRAVQEYLRDQLCMIETELNNCKCNPPSNNQKRNMIESIKDSIRVS